MRRLILLALLCAAPAAAGAQPIVTSDGPQGVEVTVYRDPDRSLDTPMNLDMLNGFALISERRRVRLPAGESVIRFEGVAAGIVPQTAIVTGFADGIVERNRDAYLLSPATLLDRSLGRRVHLRRTSRATGAVREQEAEIVSSAAGALVMRTADGLESLRCTGIPETIVYEEVPATLSARPTLSVRTRSRTAVEAVVTLSYLAAGFDWQANYIGQLSPDEQRLDLFAWLTLGSNDETSFPNADTQAVAGQINYTRAQPEPVEGPPLTLQCWQHLTTSDIPLQDLPPPPPLPAAPPMNEDYETIVVTGSRVAAPSLESATPIAVLTAEQENLGDLKLYRVPEPVTVAANAQKQVALLVRQVRVDTVYRARLDASNPGHQSQATRFIVTRNREAEGLGLPLPAGGMTLFTQRQGRPLLIGEAMLYDRAVGDDVEIGFNQSPSVQVSVEGVRNSKGELESYRLVVTNDQPRPVSFEAELEVPDNRRLQPGQRLQERDGRPLWRVTVPANGSATLPYRVAEIAG